MSARHTISETAIVRLDPQATAAVRIRLPTADLDLGAAFDRYLPIVGARLASVGGSISGPPFGRYHAFGPETVDVEIGFPVAGPTAGLPPIASCPPGEVGASELPGGPVARTIHRGAYEDLSRVYDELHAWIHEQPGYDDDAGPWESYVDNPDAVPDVADLRTEVVWPLRAV